MLYLFFGVLTGFFITWTLFRTGKEITEVISTQSENVDDNKTVPMSWNQEDIIESYNKKIGYLYKINPTRETFIIKDYFTGNLKEYKYLVNTYYNHKAQNRELEKKAEDWEDYNQALVEVHKKYLND